MKQRTLDEIISYYDQQVLKMDIKHEDKIKLLGMITAIGYKVQKHEWIPCSEQLPEDETKYYLVTVANHGLFFTTTSTDSVEIVRWDYDRRKGRDSWHWCTERTVIAWMPLPEVYGGGT